MQSNGLFSTVYIISQIYTESLLHHLSDISELTELTDLLQSSQTPFLTQTQHAFNSANVVSYAQSQSQSFLFDFINNLLDAHECLRNCNTKSYAVYSQCVENVLASVLGWDAPFRGSKVISLNSVQKKQIQKLFEAFQNDHSAVFCNVRVFFWNFWNFFG